MNNKTASDLICVIASVILMIMTLVSFLEGQRVTYQVNTGLFCALMCLLPMIFRKAKLMDLPASFVVVIEISIFMHAYGVLLMRYDDVTVWDTVTHTVSSITVALCAFYALMAITVFDNMIKITKKWMPLFILLIMMTFAAYWEAFEFVADELWNTNMQYSPWDTIRDLTCDILGASAVAVYSHLYLAKKDAKTFVDELNIHPFLKKVAKSRG